MSRKYIKKIFQPRKKKTHYRFTRKDKPKGKRKTHKDEPILANKRVLRFSIPNQACIEHLRRHINIGNKFKWVTLNHNMKLFKKFTGSTKVFKS